MSDKNPLEMSDEEILEAPVDQFEQELDEADNSVEAQADGQEEEQATQEADTDSPTEGQEEEREAEASEDKDQDDSEVLEDQPQASPVYAESDAEESEVSSGSSDDQSEQEAIDYKAVYEQVFAPFKANGKEMRVSSPEDVRQLMQMGANYNKKMAAMKPHLRVLKTLEKNELLDEDKISFLIDLANKRPEAIAKLVKDSEVDPMDLDLTEGTDEYVPNAHMATEQEVALEAILDEIRETETFSRTVDELGNKWDAESRRVIADKPELIKVINDHIAMGIYDQIMAVVEQERVLGKLNGVPDLQAYKQVGDTLEANGAFNKPKARKQPEKPQNPKVTARKRAAAPTRGSAAKQTEGDLNPLAMPDEEFEKAASSKFM